MAFHAVNALIFPNQSKMIWIFCEKLLAARRGESWGNKISCL